MRRLARPYAEALLAAAGSPERAAVVKDELASFLAALEAVPQLRRVAANPAVPLEVKEKVLAEIGDRLGLSPMTRRLLRSLLVRYRLDRLAEVVEGIGELVNRRLGVVVAEVASASPLSDEERARLRGVLEKKLDKRVELVARVEPDLLAGFVVRAGSTLWDASVRGQLGRLTRELAEA